MKFNSGKKINFKLSQLITSGSSMDSIALNVSYGRLGGKLNCFKILTIY